MGKKLLEAVQVRNTLETMVQSGAISGTKADAWKIRIEQDKEVAHLRKRAESGDVRVIFTIGVAYFRGSHGLKVDSKQAFAWFKRAADLDHPSAIANCGVMLCSGDGVKKAVSQGLIMIGQGAGLGSEHACWVLCEWHQTGKHGLKKDPLESM